MRTVAGGAKVAHKYFDIYFKKEAALAKLRAEAGGAVFIPPLDWSWASAKQGEFSGLAKAGNVLGYGDRQTGKGLTLFCTWVDMNRTSADPVNLLYMNTSIDKGRAILGKYMTDPIIKGRGFQECIGKNWSSTQARMPNGGTFTVIPCKPSSVVGYTAQVVWIDDLESALREEPEACGKAVMTMRAQDGGHIWCASNNASGNFRNLRDGLEKLGARFPVITIEKADVPQIKFENDDVIEAFAVATMGEEQMLAQLYNMDVNTEGEWFNADLVDGAFAAVPDKLLPTRYDAVEIGVDLGFNHPAAIEVVGRVGRKPLDSQYYELEGYSKSGLTPSEIVSKICEIHDRVSKIYADGRRVRVNMESNSGGAGIAEELRRRKVPTTMLVTMSNFTDDVPKDAEKAEDYKWAAESTGVPKKAVIGFILKLMAGSQVHLHNKTLQGQLRRYCGDKQLDDSVDALLHAVHALNRGGSGASGPGTGGNVQSQFAQK
jgi:hypothetical protein